MEHEDPNTSSPRNTITRRYFLELVGIGSVLVTVAGGSVLSIQYLSPNVLLEPPSRFKAGTVEDYAADSVTLVVDQKTFVVRAQEGYFYAMSAVCTHLGCITAWDPGAGLVKCPCHGSRYDREGNVVAGPAPRPLPHFAMTLDQQKQLVVDKGTIVSGDAILRV